MVMPGVLVLEDAQGKRVGYDASSRVTDPIYVTDMDAGSILGTHFKAGLSKSSAVADFQLAESESFPDVVELRNAVEVDVLVYDTILLTDVMPLFIGKGGIGPGTDKGFACGDPSWRWSGMYASEEVTLNDDTYQSSLRPDRLALHVHSGYAPTDDGDVWCDNPSGLNTELMFYDGAGGGQRQVVHDASALGGDVSGTPGGVSVTQLDCPSSETWPTNDSKISFSVNELTNELSLLVQYSTGAKWYTVLLLNPSP